MDLHDHARVHHDRVPARQGLGDVHGNVGATGLEHSHHGHQGARTAVRVDPRVDPRSDAQLPQQVSQLIGAFVQFAVGQRFVRRAHGDSVRRPFRLLLEDLVEHTIAGLQDRAVDGGEQLLLLDCEKGEQAHRECRVRTRALRQPQQMADRTQCRELLEDIGVIAQFAREPPFLMGDAQVQVALRRARGNDRRLLQLADQLGEGGLIRDDHTCGSGRFTGGVGDGDLGLSAVSVQENGEHAQQDKIQLAPAGVGDADQTRDRRRRHLEADGAPLRDPRRRRRPVPR